MVEVWVNDISAFSADTIRAQLAEVRVYILAQDGQRDDTYTHPVNPILVGSPDLGTSFGRSFSIDNFRNYRWKVNTVVVKPRNLAN
jgi:hypothetical protein